MDKQERRYNTEKSNPPLTGCLCKNIPLEGDVSSWIGGAVIIIEQAAPAVYLKKMKHSSVWRVLLL